VRLLITVIVFQASGDEEGDDEDSSSESASSDSSDDGTLNINLEQLVVLFSPCVFPVNHDFFSLISCRSRELRLLQGQLRLLG